MVTKLTTLIKKYKKSSILIALIIIGIVGFSLKKGPDDGATRIVKAQIGTVKQEVSVTGRVKPSQTVDLSFDRSGRIINVAVKTGYKVRTGQTLAQIESSELLAQRQRETASVAVAEERLNQALDSLNNTNSSGNLAAAALSKALKTAVDAMVDFTKLQYAFFTSPTGESNMLADAKEETLYAIYGQPNLGRVNSWYFLALNSGLKQEIADAEQNPTMAGYDALIQKTRDALLKVKTSLELLHSSLNNTAAATPADISLIKSDLDLVINQLPALTTQNKSLANESFDIRIAQAQLEQARANLALIDAQIAKNSLRAPFAGTITAVDIEPGETVSGKTAISMISSGKYQIEVNISEADIAKIKIGNTASVKFDAYGSEAVFDASIAYIDPAATINNGIAVYGVTLELAKQDDRILAGLTADIDIRTSQKENVLYVPSRDVITRDGTKYVKMLVDEQFDDARFANLTLISESKAGKVYEVEVKTGLKGSDGRIEIVSGLNADDLIISD